MRKKTKKKRSSAAKSGRKLRNGGKFTCPECGLAVAIEECCDCDTDYHDLVCRDTSMQCAG